MFGASMCINHSQFSGPQIKCIDILRLFSSQVNGVDVGYLVLKSTELMQAGSLHIAWISAEREMNRKCGSNTTSILMPTKFEFVCSKT